MTKAIGSRADYRWFLNIPTRWMDNDVFGHVNNVVYYSWFDTTVARFLMDIIGINTLESETVFFVVETQCRYHAPVAFPDDVAIGLRVERLGTSSIRYGLGAFRNDAQDATAEGHFVHVAVTKATGRPTATPDTVRRILEGFKVVR